MDIVSVVIVTRNHHTTIGMCLDSILAERKIVIDFEVIVVDNASSDGTLQIIEAKGIRPTVCQTNLGFCGATNLGLRKARGNYVLLLNPDARIAPGYLSKAVAIMKANPGVALLTGKVLRMHADGTPEIVDNYAVIDSTGIHLRLDRQAVDIGMGRLDKGQYDRPGEVEAVSGAVCFCRSEALSELMIDGEVFDELFFAYKEDVDLGWRARRIGWICYYTPELIAYHLRGWRGGYQARSTMPIEARYHSFKNRRITILKNETINGFLLSCFPIIGFEAASFGYALILDTDVLKAYGFIWKNLPRIYRWRREINQRAKQKRKK